MRCVSWLVIMWRSAETWTLLPSVNITLSLILSTAGTVVTVNRLFSYTVHPYVLLTVFSLNHFSNKDAEVEGSIL